METKRICPSCQKTLPADVLLAALPWLLVGVAAVKAVAGVLQWFLWERASELAAQDNH